MDQQFYVESSLLDADTLRRQFESATAVRVEDPAAAAGYRSPELIALVGLASGGLGAFIKGMFDVAVANAASKIVLKTADGTTLEAPASSSPQRIAQLADQLKNLELSRVQIY